MTIATAQSDQMRQAEKESGRTIRRLLITGARGFVGNHLCEIIAGEIAAERSFGSTHILCTTASPIEDDAYRAFPFDLVRMDLRATEDVRRIVLDYKPDAVLHLAGHSRVQGSWNASHATYDVNTMGTVRLLEAIKETGLHTRFLFIGSGDIYGEVRPETLPTSEAAEPHPGSPYAASKMGAEIAALQYGRSVPEIDVAALRPFAHTGPGQSPDFVCPAFAQQIARIEANLQPGEISVGNLSARRDLLDVRDVARAYILALWNAPSLQPFNVASGESILIEDILKWLMEMANVTITVRRDRARMRPVDTPEIRGDASAFQAATGWAPVIPFRQTLADLLEYSRMIVRQEQAEFEKQNERLAS